jgi:hypothetical protein
MNHGTFRRKMLIRTYPISPHSFSLSALSSMSLPSPRNQAQAPGFRASICLNNAAVTMLERGCFRQGLETLQDAIAVMKDAFQGKANRALGGSESAPSPTSVPKQEIEEKLLRSSNRSLVPDAVAAGKRMRVHSLSCDGSGFCPEVLCHLQESPAVTCFFPVRIDMVAVDWRRKNGRETTDSASDMDQEAAILLYNFGVANLLLSEAVVERSSPAQSLERLRSCALSVFQLSSTIVSRCAQTCEGSIEEADLLHVTLLVFHATIQVLVFAGNDAEALLVFERYESIRRAVAALHASPWFSNPKSVAAAA